ncbi:MAG: trigger factor [Elusimicrobia bacterium]|nr:trigger factor [Elusimicrobiota bacterium]
MLFSSQRDKEIKKISHEGCVYVFSVMLAGKTLEDLRQQALVRLQSIVAVPGFRQGKAPLNIIERQFPSMIKDEIIDIAGKSLLAEIIKNERLTPVVTPVLKTPKYEEKKFLSFEIQLECSPAFDAKGYDNINVTKKMRKIADPDVENYLHRLREYNSYLKPADEGHVVGGNHFVLVDYEAHENGAVISEAGAKGELVDMSSPQTIAGLSQAILGAGKGDTREFDSEFSGRNLHFKVNVLEIKEKVIPELDSNFLKETGAVNLEELQKKIREMLENSEKEKAEKEVISQIEDSLIKNNPFILPPSLVREETKELFEILKKRVSTKEEVKEDVVLEKLKPLAERNLRIAYLLRRIAEKEKIEATEEELNAEMEKSLAGLETEEEKQKLKELFRNRREYILASIAEIKTMNFIKSKALIKEEVSSKD